MPQLFKSDDLGGGSRRSVYLRRCRINAVRTSPARKGVTEAQLAATSPCMINHIERALRSMGKRAVVQISDAAD